MKNLSIIVVLFFALSGGACKKHTPPSLASIHTKRMTKDWKWSRQYIYSFYMQDDIVTTYTDTVMPITETKEGSIEFNGNWFVYYGGIGDYWVDVDTTEKLVYVDPDFPGIFDYLTSQRTVYIEYYYHQDSVVYVDIDAHKRGSNKWQFRTIK